MSRALLPLVAVLVALAASGFSAAEAADDALDRFVLAIGANDGGGDRVRLRYATADARGFAEVMGEYGGVFVHLALCRHGANEDGNLERAVLGNEPVNQRGEG